MTTPPTDEQRAIAAEFVPHEGYCALWMARGKPCQCSQRGKIIEAIAQALADQAAAIHARYEKVAEVVEQWSEEWGDDYHRAAEMIREVSR